MKNKRGFTLVELLVVIVLLMLILLLAYPNFYKLTESYKSSYDATTRVLLKNAASMYVNNNINEVEEYFKGTSTPFCIPIGKLIAYEYLDSDLKDSNGDDIPKNRCINVTKSVNSTTGEITYEYNTLTTATAPSGTDYLPPEIYMVSKNKSDYECKSVMYVTEEQLNTYSASTNTEKVRFTNFIEAKCTIGARDNVDGDISANLTAVVSINKTGNRFYITYNVQDSSGNKADPLRVELILSNDNN